MQISDTDAIVEAVCQKLQAFMMAQPYRRHYTWEEKLGAAKAIMEIVLSADKPEITDPVGANRQGWINVYKTEDGYRPSYKIFLTKEEAREEASPMLVDSICVEFNDLSPKDNEDA